MNLKRIEHPAWILLAELIAFWPSVHWFYSRTRYASEESWQLLALLVVPVVLVLHGRRGAASTRAPSSLLGPALGVAAHAALQPFVPPLPAAVLAVFVLCWTTSLLFLGSRFNLALFALGLLALPVVQVFQYHLGLPLRIATASGAELLLRSCGLEVVRHGTCLDWGGFLVWVDPPCSGLRMLWTTLFLAALLSAVWRLSARSTLVAGGLAFVLVLIGNTLRTTSLFFLETGAMELPEFAHAGIGLVSQALVALALSWFLVRLERRRPGAKPCV